MPSISSILGNPLADVLKAAGDIVGRFVTDPNAKVQASIEIAKLQADYADRALAADTEIAKSQQAVLVAEASSTSWLARNWRPILMLTFTYIIAHNYVIGPLFSVRTVPIPPDMWELLKLGIGGYIIGRSAEKIAPSLADAIAGKAPSDKSTAVTVVNANGDQS